MPNLPQLGKLCAASRLPPVRYGYRAGANSTPVSVARQWPPAGTGVKCLLPVRQRLFHRDAFGQVARLIDLAAARFCKVVGEMLKGDDRRERSDIARTFRNTDNVLRELGNLGQIPGLTKSSW